ncbi:MAG: tetratricopeptide repeat protein [Saprospiraceae bacterium]|nr:tetratricopeptide repeat protein [Saprospiraceae bacterium]
MAKRKERNSAEEVVVDVQEVQGNALSLPANFQQYLVYAFVAVALLVAGWWMYRNFVVKPRNQEAMAAMWQAQQLFERDSFQMALENPGGGYEGFLGIIDNFGGTKAANLSHYYAGVCYLQTRQIDEAIAHLEKFKPSDELLPIMKNGILGDCYSEKKEFDTAIKYYKKAVDAGNNELLQSIYLKKLGLLYDYQGNKAEARKAFERYKRDFPNQSSPEWRDIDKYISRNAE